MNNLIVNEFLELVQIDASSENERGVADALTEKLKTLGLVVTEDDVGEKVGGNAGNVTGILEGTKEGSILFTAHMDRVEKGYGIKPRIEGERIVSDGSTILAADDLSGAAAIIDGIRMILEEKLPHPRIEVVFCVGEEKQLQGSRHYDFSKIQSKIGYALDSPGRIGRIINGAPSYAKLYVDVTGKAAHAGNEPEKGISALKIAGKILADIREGRLDDESSANFSICTAGKLVNIVCEKAHIEGEARSRNHEKLAQYCDYFEKLCAEKASGTGAVVETRVEDVFRRFYIPEDGPTISLLKKVFGKMGITPLIQQGGGGMDANRFNDHGIECVGLATGYAENHTVKEYIYVEDLIQSGEMVKQIIMNY